jgi:hypothetical protein
MGINLNVTLESTIAKDLILFKLNSINRTLESILAHWQEENADDFIEKVRNGEIPDAEMDGITVRQLLSDIDKLTNLLKSLNLGK